MAAGTNHTAPSSKTVSVTVSMPSGTLANNGAAEIKAAAQSGQAENLWSVGDKVGIKINGTVGSLAINDTYATPAERRILDEMYKNYKAHGWNGDMDARLEKVYELRTDHAPASISRAVTFPKR